ncbi:MAG: twitching motility protein PilT [Nitriliruptor sp.]|nr:MAG: twitching motility protein PilT [Nitriliruptor sp.]
MIIYGPGALVAAERNVRPLWALHDAALRRHISPLVPAGVLAQVWRGGPQANLSRLLAGCTVTPLDESLARAAGTLCGQARTSDVVDASVVLLARVMAAPVVTGDAADLRALAGAAGWPITLHEI